MANVMTSYKDWMEQNPDVVNQAMQRYQGQPAQQPSPPPQATQSPIVAPAPVQQPQTQVQQPVQSNSQVGANTAQQPPVKDEKKKDGGSLMDIAGMFLNFLG